MDEQLTQAVKKVARNSGADLVGIGSMDRFEGAPKEWDPRYMFPDAKAIIALGFRIPRGFFRGVEEGTYFYTYPTLGYSNINEVYAPIVLREVSCYLEDNGYEGFALRSHGGAGPADVMNNAVDGEQGLSERTNHTRPVREGLPAPDVTLHFRIAAYVCGLGEIGFSKIFLTPEYGPRQRFAFVLTDAPLVPDPIYDGPPLCDRCKLCVNDCPGALNGDRTSKVTVAGHKLEWADLDPWQCMFAYASGLKELNPFLPDDAYGTAPKSTDREAWATMFADPTLRDDVSKQIPGGEDIMNGLRKPTREEVHKILWGILPKYYPWSPGGTPPGYFPAMCNGRGCMRACFVHLEQQGKLKNKFHNKFRKRTPWFRETAE
jgi:epoxyqueuosine reductase